MILYRVGSSPAAQTQPPSPTTPPRVGSLGVLCGVVFKKIVFQFFVSFSPSSNLPAPDLASGPSPASWSSWLWCFLTQFQPLLPEVKIRSRTDYRQESRTVSYPRRRARKHSAEPACTNERATTLTMIRDYDHGGGLTARSARCSILGNSTCISDARFSLGCDLPPPP